MVRKRDRDYRCLACEVLLVQSDYPNKLCAACRDTLVKKNRARIARQTRREPKVEPFKPLKHKQVMRQLGLLDPCQRREGRVKCKVAKKDHGQPHGNGCPSFLGVSPRIERGLLKAERKKEREAKSEAKKRQKWLVKEQARLKRALQLRKIQKETEMAAKKKAAKKIVKGKGKKAKADKPNRTGVKDWFRAQLEKGEFERKALLAEVEEKFGVSGRSSVATYLATCKKEGNKFGVLLVEVLRKKEPSKEKTVTRKKKVKKVKEEATQE
jgi:hypothetical protein